MAFNRKVLRITLTLSGENQSFSTENKNSLSAIGLRASAEINYGNGSPAPSARVKIYGLPIETADKLLRIKFNSLNGLRDAIAIEAGDQDSELVPVFKGGITFAYPDFGDAPNVALIIESQTAVLESMAPVDAESYKGYQDVVNIMGQICERVGYTLESNDVNAKLNDVYLCDTDMKKIRKLADDADLDLYLENNLVAITPKGQPRKIKIPVISPETGLIGYPTPTMIGVDFKCFFDPLIRFGGIARIKNSTVERCNGDWLIYGSRSILETEQESARWHMEISAQNLEDSKNVAIKK